jgi:phage baseplate assembly protein W
MDTTSLGFPFRINGLGRPASLTGDDNIRARIVQALLTAPGERVMLPEFGCGLRDLVFDPNNEVLAATTQFAVTRALQQWLGDEIFVQSVEVTNDDGQLQIEVAYIRLDQFQPGKIKITF